MIKKYMHAILDAWSPREIIAAKWPHSAWNANVVRTKKNPIPARLHSPEVGQVAVTTANSIAGAVFVEDKYLARGEPAVRNVGIVEAEFQR